MIEIAPGWMAEVERGPDWLLVRLQCPARGSTGEVDLAESLWALLRQHFTHRLVLELDQLPVLSNELVGQLVRLHKRIVAHDGVLRVSGLSESSCRLLKNRHLESRFPKYTTRYDAVMAHPTCTTH